MATNSESQDSSTGEHAPGSLGGYVLGPRIGEGGMGVVYRGQSPTGRDVAIKVLRPHIAHDPEARRRLEREVSTLSQVTSDRVARVLDADVWGEAPYLVTDYVPGRPLDAIVAHEGPLEGPALLRVAQGLAEALQAIHGVGIVHRDLKPGNVLMVGADPVVIDFGIAQVADDVRMTMTGMVMGTPGYLSPEVVEGDAVSEATDWWGWAATLAYANSGEPPFGRAPMSVILDRVTRGRFRLDGVDPQLRPLLAAALDPDPSVRPRVGEVIEALELYANDKPVTMALSRQYGAAGPSQPSHAWAAEEADEADFTRAHHMPQTRMAPVQPRQPQPAPPPHQPPPHQPSQPLAGGYAQQPPPGGYAPQASPAGYGQPAQPYADPGGDPRIGKPARAGVLAALALAFIGFACVAPLAAWTLLALWSVGARIADYVVTGLVLRRFDAGKRRSDTAMSLVASPWHLLRGAFTTALALLLPVGFAIASALGIVLVSRVATSSAIPIDHPIPVGIGSLLGVLVAWWGPGGLSLRRGSRSLVRGVVPVGAASALATGFLMVVGAALAAWAIAEGGTVSLWPFDPVQRPWESWDFSSLVP